MRKFLLYIILSVLFLFSSYGVMNKKKIVKSPAKINLAEQNLIRSMKILDSAIPAYFTDDEMRMARFYNPFLDSRSDETGSVWMYTSSIEALNAVLHALKVQKENDNPKLYNLHFNKYKEILGKLYENVDYYLGTFTLISYTQTKEWTIYGVNRGREKGKAKVSGIENVYDDQMWLIRELIESYKLTNNKEYLQKAEYLTEYVLDGWDSTRDEDGQEMGGIPWGPGYVTKHACSNGPLISPLVWLHEIYKDKSEIIVHRFIDPADKLTRKTTQVNKSEYYLDFAKKVYDWQKKHLIRSDGVYADMMGGCSPKFSSTETIDGVEFRKGITCRNQTGPPYSYNSGTMLSGAVDLYRATGNSIYLEDAKDLTDASFEYFAKLDDAKPGYYTYDIGGFRNWFNGVLMRGYVDIYSSYKNASECINSFQKNLDYGYDNYLYKGFLPRDLLNGWNKDKNENKVEGMFTFAFAAEYAVLSKYESIKKSRHLSSEK